MRPLILSAALLAPGAGLAQDFPVTVTDHGGRQVTVAEAPRRVFCLLADCIQHLAVVGAVPAAAMEADIGFAASPTTLGPRAGEIVPFAWGEGGPDIEAILAFAPDLILMEPWTAAEPMFDVLEESLPHYTTAGPYPDWSGIDPDNAEDWAAYTRDMVNVGALLGRRAEALAFAARLRDRLAAYRRLAPGGASYVRTRVEQDDDMLWAPPCLPLLAGLGECLSLDDDWIEITPEALLALDPEVIFIEESAYRDIDLAALGRHPLWSELSALRAGRVHVVGYDQFYDATPLVLSNTLDTVMPLLYPDTFPAPLTDDQVAAALRE